MFVIIWKLYATQTAYNIIINNHKNQSVCSMHRKVIFKLIENFSTFLFWLVGVSAQISSGWKCCAQHSTIIKCKSIGMENYIKYMWQEELSVHSAYIYSCIVDIIFIWTNVFLPFYFHQSNCKTKRSRMYNHECVRKA